MLPYILVELAKNTCKYKNFFFQKDTFHPDKKLVAVKIMHLDYSRLGAQVHGCLFILFLTRAKYTLDTDCSKVITASHVLSCKTHLVSIENPRTV